MLDNAEREVLEANAKEQLEWANQHSEVADLQLAFVGGGIGTVTVA